MSNPIDPVKPIDLKKKKGLVFVSHDVAVKSNEQWAEENLCPLTKARFTKSSFTKDGFQYN